jgi:hypothetical protein
LVSLYLTNKLISRRFILQRPCELSFLRRLSGIVGDFSPVFRT